MDPKYFSSKAKGIIIKGVNEKDKFQSFINKEIIKGNLKDFTASTVMIGGELAYNLNLKLGDNKSYFSN